MASHINLDDIESWEYVLEPTVYDISIRDNHNYYIFCGKEILVHNSAKTYSIILSLIDYAFDNKDKAKSVITIVRKTLPALKGSALRDFIAILENEKLYNEKDHNKTANEYTLFNTLFEFIGTDQPQKVRGRKRNILFCNEANELTKEDFRQLAFRTTDLIILDYNPSEPDSWIYTEAETRKDCITHVTTYKDNPFLEESLIAEIERYKEVDPEYWKIYGEGKIGQLVGVIYKNWKECDELPKPYKWRVIAVDYGFTNDPTAIIEIRYSDGELWLKEHCYRHGMLNADIDRELSKIDRIGNTEIVPDSAEPKSNEELKRMGWNVHPAVKGADSVRFGIQLLQKYKLNVTSDSLNLIKELKNYKWRTDKKTGDAMNEPIDAFNHLLDALRYGVTHRLSTPEPVSDFSSIDTTIERIM